MHPRDLQRQMRELNVKHGPFTKHGDTYTVSFKDNSTQMLVYLTLLTNTG